VALAVGLILPAALDAQPAPRIRIGILSTGAPRTSANYVAFIQRLGDLGYVEGRNLTIDFGSADNKPGQLAEVARELVSLWPAVILASGIPDTALAAKKATATTPIVFTVAVDPVRAGLVASLARPGGNATGVSSLNADLAAKRLELVTDLIPGLRRVAVLVTPLDPETPTMIRAVESAARDRSIQLHLLEIRDASRLDGAVGDAVKVGAGAVLVLGSPPFYQHQVSMAKAAAKHRLPVVSAWREFPEAGGLASYGTDVVEMFQRAAGLVDRILKGAKPADLPVEQPTKFELAINGRAARALGLTIPPAVLLRADRVID
jgi:putative ABC transport system substrate-binding protein